MNPDARIVLLGASGATGQQVIRVAAERKLSVVAQVRDAARAGAFEGLPRVEVVEAPLSDLDRLADAMAGADAVVSALGVASRSPDAMPSEHMGTVAEAMKRAGVDRYVGISGAGLTLEGEQKKLMGRFMSWLVERMAPAVVEDKRREYRFLRQSDLRWTLARAPRLTDAAPTGQVATANDRPPSFELTRGDAAAFLLDAIERDDLVGEAPYVSSKK